MADTGIMRDTTVKGLDDDFTYSFGCSFDIMWAAVETAQKVGVIKEKSSYLVTSCILSGKDLILFIHEHAKEHEKIIEKINEEYKYELTAWDW